MPINIGILKNKFMAVVKLLTNFISMYLVN